jgi:hypothetical protein
VWDVEEEEVETMGLLDDKEKELGVALKKVVLKVLEEAEEGLVQVESLVETEVNHPFYQNVC